MTTIEARLQVNVQEAYRKETYSVEETPLISIAMKHERTLLNRKKGFTYQSNSIVRAHNIVMWNKTK